MYLEYGNHATKQLNGHMWNWGPIYSARENIHYDFPDLQVSVLDWWATNNDIMINL